MTSVRFAVAVIALLLPLTACSSGTDDNTSAKDPAEKSGEVEALPFNASGLLGGNAKPEFPAGDPGDVSVVQVGPLVKTSDSLLIAFRNNTDHTVSGVKWTASARSDGNLVSSGSSVETIPAQVASGEIGLTNINFENSESIPDGSDYEFSADSADVGNALSPLKVTESNLVDDAIVGEATNETGSMTTGPFLVSIYCFDGSTIRGYKSGLTETSGNLEDGDRTTFVVELYGAECASYVVGVGAVF